MVVRRYLIIDYHSLHPCRMDGIMISAIRICAQLIGGILAFPVLGMILPEYIEVHDCW